MKKDSRFTITKSKLEQIIKEEYASMKNESSIVSEISKKFEAVNKDNKFKITKSELEQIIKEEYASMSNSVSRAGEIKSRLKEINEELKSLPNTLSEVEAVGVKGIKSTGWTGAGESDKKYGEKFEKIGSHLKEDDEIEGEIEIGGDDELADDLGYFVTKYAEVGKQLDTKIFGEDVSDEEMSFDIDVEEMEVEEMEVEDEEEVEEVEDEIEGIDDEIDTDDVEGLNEGMKKGTTLLSEGKTSAQKNALDRELERMKALAKIR